MVVWGRLANPKLSDGRGRGTSELHILGVVKSNPALAKRKMVILDRYIPVLDNKKPPVFLIFFDIVGKKFDGYHGRPVNTPDLIKYIEGVKQQQGKSRVESLLYFFPYLQHEDQEISTDAFLEFAKANDSEVGRVAQKLPADTIRSLLLDEKTPASRLSLYAFLLGAAGNQQDAELIRSLLERPTRRTTNATDGLLCGYIQLRPKDGWNRVASILGDEKKDFTLRYAVGRVLSFYHNWKPKESRPQIVRCLGVMLDSDIADLAVTDLRKWQVWDWTEKVLALYRNPKSKSPVLRRGIIRYALACPQPTAQKFISDLRRSDSQLITEVERTLALEKR